MDVTKFTPQQMNSLRKVFHALNHFMVFMWKIGLGKAIKIWTAGFGSISDLYRNMLVYPRVELYLLEGTRTACAEEISGSPHRLFLTRQIAIASGFAAPLLGINIKKLSDEQLDDISKEYRLVHFIMSQ
jgi:hypothetical protein